MRKRTVRTGVRFMIAAIALLLLGTFYSQQINSLLSLPADGAFEFVTLAFFWSGIFGATGVVVLIFGLLQRASAGDRFSLVPVFFLFIFLLTLFFTLFYRTLSAPTGQQPLQPGETLLI